MRDIDTDKIVANLEEMIEVLEFDSMRSAGKAKLNSQHLHAMYWLIENVYKKPVNKKTPAKKEA